MKMRKVVYSDALLYKRIISTPPSSIDEQDQISPATPRPYFLASISLLVFSMKANKSSFGLSASFASLACASVGGRLFGLAGSGLALGVGLGGGVGLVVRFTSSAALTVR
ncbi:hypothetical protein P7C70_g1546, partial [Phenoliferia sp. Uapishka_3]